MKFIALAIISLLLISCDKFDEGEMLANAFGVDLVKLTEGKKTSYSDGLLLVYDVSDGEALYATFFTDLYKEGDVHISFKGTQFDSTDVGVIRYRLLDSFDGYTQTIFYIPKEKTLGFGYSDGLM